MEIQAKFSNGLTREFGTWYQLIRYMIFVRTEVVYLNSELDEITITVEETSGEREVYGGWNLIDINDIVQDIVVSNAKLISVKVIIDPNI